MRALEVYELALRTGADLHAVDGRGSERRLPAARWLGPPTGEDETVLARVHAPVLDVGCGPGRLVGALSSRGIRALGVDPSREAVRLTRRRGAAALHGSVFEPLPGSGGFGSALLLDGNLGIGGCPLTLLRRVAAVLRPGGLLLVEPERHGGGPGPVRLRLPAGGLTPPFPWAQVSEHELIVLAGQTGLTVRERWQAGERSFVSLATPG